MNSEYTDSSQAKAGGGRFRRFVGGQRLVYKTSWKFRFLASGLLVLLFFSTARWWGPVLGRSLVCPTEVLKSDVILIHNLDLDYLLFEKAAELQRDRVGTRVLIPVQSSKRDDRKTNAASQEIAEGLCRVAKIQDPELVPVREEEPITFSVAVQIGERLKAEGIGSIILVTPGFRSKRDILIYQTALAGLRVRVSCVPVFGSRTPENWIQSWHGVQEVGMQLGKLIYYRIRVL